MGKIKQWFENLFSGITYHHRDCTCGKYKKCTIRHYITSRGDMGIKDGMTGCGEIQKQIKDFSKMINNIDNTSNK